MFCGLKGGRVRMMKQEPTLNKGLLKISLLSVHLAGCTYPLRKGLEKILKSILTSSQQHLQFLNLLPKCTEMQCRPPTLHYVCIKQLWNEPSTLTACIKILPYSSVRKTRKRDVLSGLR